MATAPVITVSNRHDFIGLAMQWLSVIFVLSQLFYLINLVLGVLISKKK
jgi:hypothetical protein